MSAFTPGPWRAQFSEGITVRAPDGSCIAQITMLSKHGRRDASENEANARAIALLPELVRKGERLLAAFEAFANDVNWGASAIRAETIREVNEAPGEFRALLAPLSIDSGVRTAQPGKSKRERILELADGTRTGAEIAKIVGASEFYVRHVASGRLSYALKDVRAALANESN